MKSNILLCLALILGGGLFGCKTEQIHDSAMVYHNAEYDFAFSLSSSWRGYSVLIEQWKGEAYSSATDKSAVVGYGSMIKLRHPQWRADALYQDIPILVFTRAQWDLLHQGKLWPSHFAVSHFAGGMMDELWHNQKFVFAMSSRYNADDEVKGWKKVQDIVQQNCVEHTMTHLYPE